MGTALVLAAILIAVLVGFWGPLRGVRTALSFGHLVSTGHAFLIFGFVLGLVLGDRAEPLTDDLAPIVPFMAGWVGFAAGMRFEIRLFRTLPGRIFAVALMPSIAAAWVVGPAAFALLTFAAVPRMMGIAAAMVLAAAAACSGPSLAAIVRGRRAGRASQVRSVLRMIELSASVDDLLLVLLVLVAFPLFRGDFVVAATVFAAGVVGGAAFGGVTWLFLGGTAGEDERLLLGLAMLAVIAGFAEWLSLSPAGVAATSAAVLVNLPGERMSRLVSAVKRVERPAVVILMTMIGLRITGDLSWIFAPLVVLFTLVRVAVKAWAGAWLKCTAPGVRSTRRWGLGLAPMGTLGMVVVLGVSQAWPHELARTLLAAAAAASLLSEIIAPWLMLRLLRTIGTSAARSTAA